MHVYGLLQDLSICIYVDESQRSPHREQLPTSLQREHVSKSCISSQNWTFIVCFQVSGRIEEEKVEAHISCPSGRRVNGSINFGRGLASERVVSGPEEEFDLCSRRV